MTKQHWLQLLERSFRITQEISECAPESRLEYLSDYIFSFTTYDSKMSKLFAHRAVEVCSMISSRLTFDYIANEENYRWFLLMCNMPFFAERIDWGTSIRGSWWTHGPIELNSDCLFDMDGEQITTPLKFNNAEWQVFVSAMIEFAEVGI